MRIRSITRQDLDALYRLAKATGPGFTSLPLDRDFLAGKIARAEASLAETAPEDALYFFVLEQDDGKIVGCCAIESTVGFDQPFYNYRVGKLTQASPQIGIRQQVDLLFISNDHTGDAEVCSLFLLPQARHARVGQLLSRARMLFLAQFADRFPSRVLAEMRGHFTDEGRSPFWEALGAHFFPMAFDEADYLTGQGKKGFIAELMPRYPIYTAFLPQSARDCIGQVHAHTRPALAMLEKEGFRYEGYIDIFDGGPTMECRIQDIRTVRESTLLPVELVDPPDDDETVFHGLAATTDLQQFRAIRTRYSPTAQAQPLTPDEARRLDIEEGAFVRAVVL
ncbi:arginine N-succinyltransferase [Terasakiispira papahanaumokuakeensis]|uniref:Arginine N-succinyltransferase n=1 Tax=Terasakiispira papahanaumokuakeensis TaxID=197479 RepID=A0A1E2VBY6_9GAMM|nr:arginine N-succinyltransferase [Terasakiispira papahanaumokuakeensis]ODC04362.1 arginine N-succinyltransferase [Terasakiispira papahanaumokuakeensis]